MKIFRPEYAPDSLYHLQSHSHIEPGKKVNDI